MRRILFHPAMIVVCVLACLVLMMSMFGFYVVDSHKESITAEVTGITEDSFRGDIVKYHIVDGGDGGTKTSRIYWVVDETFDKPIVTFERVILSTVFVDYTRDSKIVITVPSYEELLRLNNMQG